MRFDKLNEPIDDAEPSGPDLDETGDGPFMNYLMLAPDRLPARFYGADGQPFDRSDIKLDDEVETIEGFLRRTKDLRLLTLDARFQAVVGNIVGFCEAVQGIEILVTQFWDTVHPRPYEGDFMMRSNAVEEIDSQVQVVLPLQYAPIVGGRMRQVTLRNYLVASGKAEARPEEEGPSLDQINQTLGDSSAVEQTDAVHAAVGAALAAMESIRQTFYEKAGGEATPNLDRVRDVLKQIDDLIVANRRDLAPAEPMPGMAGADGTEGGVSISTGSTIQVGLLSSQEDARAALDAAAAYFRRNEPSSPAFVLVHQARMLLGRPLVDVVETLLPNNAAYAAMQFDAGFKFSIDLGRMRVVTDDALAADMPDEDAVAAPEPEAAPADDNGWSSSGYSSPALEDVTAVDADEPAPAGEDPYADAAPDIDSATPAEVDIPPEPAPAAAPPSPPAPAAPRVFRARTRGDAGDLIQAVETYFRAAEPSSPLPVLLGKARTYLNKDFAFILNELMPKETL